MCFSESQRKSGPHSTIRNLQDPNAFVVEKVSDLPKLCNLRYSWVYNYSYVYDLYKYIVCVCVKCTISVKLQ